MLAQTIVVRLLETVVSQAFLLLKRLRVLLGNVLAERDVLAVQRQVLLLLADALLPLLL